MELTWSDLREINSASDKITLQGERYPEHLQKLVVVELGEHDSGYHGQKEIRMVAFRIRLIRIAHE